MRHCLTPTVIDRSASGAEHLVLAWAHDSGADLAKTNVNGGGRANTTIIERLT
jgi:hypothetical protein